MADFVAVLKKTIDGLADNTPELRQRVYAKARQTVAAKLSAITPPPPQIVVDRQHKALEEAIEAVEASYMEAVAPRSDDFESVLAELTTPPPVATTPVRDFSAPPPGPLAPAPRPIMPAATLPDAVAKPQASASVAQPPHADAAARTGRLQTPPELEADAGKQDDLAAIEAAPRQVPAQESLAPARKAAAPRRRVSGALIAAAIAAVVLAGAGYGAWLNRDAFADLFGLGGNVVAENPAAQPPAVAAGGQAEGQDDKNPEAPVEVAAAQPEAPAEAARVPQVEKFTQRLHVDGTESDPGPAGGEARVGEGTTLAAATVAGADAAGDAAATRAPSAAPAALPVGQRAVFYEERTMMADGSADEGATVWSVVQESPGGDLPPEPAVRAEVSIPSRDLSIRITIRRNADASLPASHIVEMIFITSGTFEGGGVDNVLRIAFKNSEAAPGAPLIGIPAKIADGYFLVALSDNNAERNQNLQLMSRESWIDIPIVYRSGRRALVTMEKGIPGANAFETAIRAWQTASAG